MDNQHRTQPGSYSFLEDDAVSRDFADINVQLLSGRHLSAEDGRCFNVLDGFREDFVAFYKALYKLKLERQIQDGSVYYYLDFFEGNKGKMSDSSRHRPLTENDTIIGLVLLKFYESKTFRQTKEVSWSTIKEELTEGEYREHYRRIFLRDAKGGRTERVWDDAKKAWLTTLKKFNRLGWVLLKDGWDEDFRCEIKPSIHRLARMYGEELLHFNEFAERVIIKDEEE